MTPQHWTEQSLSDFAYWIASDFTAQIETLLEDENISKNEFANRLDVSVSRVSQVLNDPGNITLGNVVKYVRALGKKVAMVVYDDYDPGNEKGPITSEVFNRCWKRMGSPSDLFPLDALVQIPPVYTSDPITQKFYRPKRIPSPNDAAMIQAFNFVASQDMFPYQSTITQEQTNVI